MKRYFIETITILAASLLSASCAKEIGTEAADWSPLTFRASTAGKLEAKAEQKEQVTDFTVAGYDNGIVWFPQSDINVSSTFDSYKWRSWKSYTFYGYANLPASGATAAIVKDGVTLTFTDMPDDSGQKDVMLGRYSGDGDKAGIASMTFYHPMASVQFKVGTLTGISSITGINISGVYKAGKTTLSMDTDVPDFIWTNVTDVKSIKQTVSVEATTGSLIGTPFIVIPQDLAVQDITIAIIAITADGSVCSILKNVMNGVWEAGKTTVYEVNLTSKGLNFTTSVKDWTLPTADQNIEFEQQ